MRSTLKDQGSQQVAKYAQQKREQQERSRNGSRERKTLISAGDNIVGGRTNSAQKQQLQPPAPSKPQQPLPRASSHHQTAPPKPSQPNSKPVNQVPSEKPQQPDPHTHLKLLKAKMSNGTTQSSQGSRNNIIRQDDQTNLKDQNFEKQNGQYRKQFTPSTDWDDTPIKTNQTPKGAQNYNSYDKTPPQQPKYPQKSKPPFNNGFDEDAPIVVSKQQSYPNKNRPPFNNGFDEDAPIVVSKQQSYPTKNRPPFNNGFDEDAPIVVSKQQSYPTKNRPPFNNGFDEDAPIVVSKQQSYSTKNRPPFNNSLDDDAPIAVSKKPPMQKKNGKPDPDAYQQQVQNSLTKNQNKQPPPRKPQQSSNNGNNKKVEYQNYNSNPFGYENPFDDELAVATGNKIIPADIDPYEGPDETELIECPEGCGRRFNEIALEKHVRVCQKVFQQKRKAFNTKQHRMISSEQANIVRQNEYNEQKKGKQGNAQVQQQKKAAPSDNRPIQGQKKSKWQAQSEAFRAILKSNNGTKLTKEEEIGYVQCDYCGRKFNEAAAQKHIPFCETKSKMSKFKSAPQKPPTTNSKKYK